MQLCRFKVRRNTVFQKVISAYAKQKHIQEDGLVFVHDGTRVKPSDTPDALGMEDGDVIDCQVHVVGGFLPLQ